MISINNLCVIQSGNSPINEGPLNTWTIPSQCQDTTSFTSTDTVRNYGKGGHYERVYKSFTVNTTGTYTISFTYNFPNVTTYGSSDHSLFGLFVISENPGDGDHSQYSNNSYLNGKGTPVCNTNNSGQGQSYSGIMTYTMSLTANTTYYFYIPLENINDYAEYFFTFQNISITLGNSYILRPIGLFEEEPTPSYTILDTVIEPNYNQYCWKIPIDILLNCKTNNLVLDITAYTTETGTGAWDGGGDYRLFALRTNYTSEYTILDGVVPFAPIDSNGYRGMTISNWSNASLSNIQTWKNNGDTNVLLHAPASQSNKFTQAPECKMYYTP